MRLSKLVENFWKLKPGKTYRCKYPGHSDHYQDHVQIGEYFSEHLNGYTRASIWLLHNNPISIYIPEAGMILVSDCGYKTMLTYSRLNAILLDRGFSFFRIFTGEYRYGFMRDTERDMFYIMPPRGYLAINLATREVSPGGGLNWLFAIPGEFFQEFEKTARYLSRRYGVTIRDIVCGIPRDVERRLKEQTKEKIGFFRLFSVAANGNGRN